MTTLDDQIMNLEDLFGEDDDRLQKGIWVVHANGPEFRVCGATDSNPRYMKMKEKVLKPLRRAAAHDAVSEKEANKALAKVYSYCIVIDWRNVKVEGVTVPYSQAECLKILIAYPKLFRWLRAEATEDSHFAIATEIETGNS